jgi:hypothetical protein
LSRADGTIVWCNNAFEEFIGYTVAEFHSGKVGWKQLTPIKEELLADEEMVGLLQSKQRTEYTMYKSYLPNGKAPTRCRVNVYAWPNDQGNVDDFVVVVWPLINGQLLAFEHTITSVDKLRSEIGSVLKMISDREKDPRCATGRTMVDPVSAWCENRSGIVARCRSRRQGCRTGDQAAEGAWLASEP